MPGSVASGTLCTYLSCKHQPHSRYLDRSIVCNAFATMNHEYRDSEINRNIQTEQFIYPHPQSEGGKSDRKRNTTYFQEPYQNKFPSISTKSESPPQNRM
jgi:hypothetical protein